MKYAPGFQLLDQLEGGSGLVYYPVGIGVAIAKGDALILTGGYAVLATTLQATTPVFIGIAAGVNTAAAAVANGTIDIAVIPPSRDRRFLVPEEDNLLVVTDVGVCVDLQSEDGIDNSDVVTAGLGFFIDDVDLSTAAVAANTYGYAIGHFETVFAS